MVISDQALREIAAYEAYREEQERLQEEADRKRPMYRSLLNGFDWNTAPDSVVDKVAELLFGGAE
jgi:hypothetical protein